MSWSLLGCAMYCSSRSLCLEKSACVQVEGRRPLWSRSLSGKLKVHSLSSRGPSLTLGLRFSSRNRQLSPAALSRSTLAAWSSSRFPTSVAPIWHTSCRGVIPAPFTASTSAPRSSSSATQPLLRCVELEVFIAAATTARWRGEFLDPFTAFEKKITNYYSVNQRHKDWLLT